LLLLQGLGQAPLLAVPNSVKQEVQLPKGRVAFRSYGTQQGLNNLAPSLLLQDHMGYVWVGTEDGLYRYDGQRFQIFDRRAGLPSTYITALHEDPQGALWVGTYQGLARYDGRRILAVQEDGGLPRVPIEGITSDGANQIWVATPRGLFQSGMGKTWTLAQGWSGGAATAVLARPGTTKVWAAEWRESKDSKEAVVQEWDGGQWRVYGRAGGPWADRVDDFAVDPKGWVWARTRRELLALAPGQHEFKPVKVPFSLTISARAGLRLDNDGRLYLPTDSGLVFFEDGRWQQLGAKEGLPVEWARDVLEDREHSLWVASLGVHRLLGRGAWQSYTTKDGLPSEVVWTLFRDHEGRLWAGTDKGLALATATGWEAFPGTAGTVVRSIQQGADGRLFLAGSPVEVLRVDPRSRLVERFGRAQGLDGKRIFRMVIDAQGMLWVATDGGGLYRAAASATALRFESVVLPGGSTKEYISGLTLDPAGHLWASGEGGLAVLDEGRWLRFTQKDGLTQTHTAYTLATRRGEFYIAYFESTGLTVATYLGGKLRVKSQLDSGALGNEKVYMLGEDARDQIWVGTGIGVHVLNGLGAEHFGSADGLVGEDINNMAFFGEVNGDVWVGTSSGLGRFDAQAWMGSPTPPTTVILNMALSESTWEGKLPEGQEVPYTQNTFEARFASLSFARETSIDYQTRLVGVEPDWHATTTREVRFPALGPGAYRFEVRSRIGQGDWGHPAAVAFRIRPAWWQTWWFRALALLSLAGGIVLAVRWRLEALRRHNRLLEDMVAARTHELQDANEALRNQSLTDPLTGLRNRRYLGVCLPEDLAQVTRTYRNKNLGLQKRLDVNIDLIFLMVDMDHFKTVNDLHGHHAGDLVLQQLAVILRASTRDTDTIVRWGGEEFLIVARNASHADSIVMAERIRSGVEKHAFDIGTGEPLKRTCSLGFSFYPFLPDPPEACSWEQVVDLADHCLYAAKRGGRNAWVGISPAPDFREDEIPKHLASEVPRLLREGRLSVQTSLPAAQELEWDLQP
jgi:diguanylate cyclase (GGDEF)-like protein